MLRCCGAPAYWAGRDDLFRESLEAVRSEWERLGMPRVITACSTCRTLFMEHIPEMETVTLWKVLEETGLPDGGASPSFGGGRRTIAVADPCITRHDRETQGSVRRIAQSLGFAIEELPLSGEKPECCGYGGLMYNADPAATCPADADHAIPVVGQIGKHADSAYYHTMVSDHDYLAYCAMCRQPGSRREEDGPPHGTPLSEVTVRTRRAGGGYHGRERRQNRSLVKGAILAELGEKGGASVEDYEKIVLDMTEEVRRRIDERRILEDDIRKVIEPCRRERKKAAECRDRPFSGLSADRRTSPSGQNTLPAITSLLSITHTAIA